jgi:hypothetical protein
MVALLVVEPLVTPGVVDVMVMVSGGITNVTLGFPKNALSVVLGEVYSIPPICFVFIVIVRFAEVPKKTLDSKYQVESESVIDVKLMQL